MGYLFKPRLKSGKPGRIWWMKYYANGRPVRESTGTDKEKVASRILKDHEGRVASGQPILPRADRIRYEEVAQDLREHYQATGSRKLDEVDDRFAHLKRFFAGRRIATVNPSDITRYVLARQAERASNATINRDLAVLRRMLRLAYESGKLLRVPPTKQLKENPPRQGFFERQPYEAVRRHLRADLQVAVAIAYAFGWRMQSEILTIERRQLDLEVGTLRLEPGTTKNDEGRLVYLPQDLKAQLAAQVERVRAIERRTGRIIPHLFPHLRGRRQGQRIRNFRKAWKTACENAGCPGMLRHDFRRTAVRNMVNAGIPERVAMSVTGHRTRAVFDRYHIVSPGDLQEVARRLTGTFSGTSAPSDLDPRRVTV